MTPIPHIRWEIAIIHPKILSPQTPISHINWEIAINIAKSPPTPKNMTPNTDATNADAPNDDEDDADDAPNSADKDADYPKFIQLYLRNLNLHCKIPPNTKKPIK